jgi:hypothetical protein
MRQPSVVDLVAERAQKYPFALAVTCLPLEGTRRWWVNQNSLLITYTLYDDWDSVVTVLSSALT